MVATAAGNKEVSKHLHGGGLKSCKLRMRVKFNVLVQTNIFCWFPASPAYSHLGTVSSSHGLSCMGKVSRGNFGHGVFPVT